MQKIFALFTLCFMCSSHSDNLSDAIRASNKDEVLKILAIQKPTQKQIVKYLDTAEQIIKLRRENIMLERQYDEELQGADKWWARMGLASLGWFIISVIMASDKTINNSRYDNFLTASTVLSSMGGFTGLIAVISVRTKQMKLRYEDALTIKEMLYDYLNEAPVKPV